MCLCSIGCVGGPEETEVSKGEILAFDWFIQCDVFHTVTLNLDNGNNQCLFDSLPSHGHKEIKINSLNNDLLATICCNIENTTFNSFNPFSAAL